MTEPRAHNTPPDEQLPFDARQYLRERNTRPDFVMVEIGHGRSPVVRNQQNLTGNRRYIGVEAWLRDPRSEVRIWLNRLSEEMVGQNVTFIDHELEGEPVYTDTGSSLDYQGAYDPTTKLDDQIADEVILSNVLGDPHISNREDSTVKLLAESHRLLKAGGKLIVRETESPLYAARNIPAAQQAVGLAQLGRFVLTPKSKAWDSLETVFDGSDLHAFDPKRPSPHSFYLVLGKLAGTDLQ